MINRHQRFSFSLSYRIDREVHYIAIEAFNLSHAKDKLKMICPEATDIINWVPEEREMMKKYLQKKGKLLV